tara:strand:- start:101 stop:562 length:462 start_codon:yes stop_codon:yes gene_type:complete
MPKIDYAAIQTRYGSSYPGILKNICNGCERKSIGEYAGLTQFGCNLTRLRPGAATSLRHWHENEDELVIVLEGEVVLIDDFGETILHPGESAGFKASESNGHQLINRAKADAILFEIGTRMDEETAHYSDEDLLYKLKEGEYRFSKRDGGEII